MNPTALNSLSYVRSRLPPKTHLESGHKEVFGKCQDRINAFIKRIKEIQSLSPSNQSGELEEALQAELAEWLLWSETLWRQKSRELWLKLGEKKILNSFIYLQLWEGKEIVSMLYEKEMEHGLRRAMLSGKGFLSTSRICFSRMKLISHLTLNILYYHASQRTKMRSYVKFHLMMR